MEEQREPIPSIEKTLKVEIHEEAVTKG